MNRYLTKENLSQVWDKITSKIGNLSNLTTTDKSSVVAAINELTGNNNFITGQGEISTLVNIPITKQTVLATVSSNQTVSVAAGLAIGRTLQIFVKNGGSTDRTITIPNTGSYMSMSGPSATLKANGWLEIHITSLSNGTYNIRIGEQD